MEKTKNYQIEFGILFDNPMGVWLYKNPESLNITRTCFPACLSRKAWSIIDVQQ